MKKLLFLSNLFPRPDAPRMGLFNLAFVCALGNHLSANEGSVSVVVPVPEWRVWRWRSIQEWSLPAEAKSSLNEEMNVIYVPCLYIPLVGRSLTYLWYAWAFRSLRPFVSACDAIIASWLYPDAVALSRLATGLGKPYWVRLHGSDRFHLDSPRRTKCCRLALEKANGILVNAHFMKQELVNRGISPARVTIIPNGVDRQRFYLQPESKQHPRRCVLWVGNMVAIKQPELAITAFKALTEMRNQADASTLQLVMIGDGPLYNEMVRLSLSLGLDQHVTFIGSQSHDAVAAWMRKADLLLLTSRSEGMPNVVIESLACGIPVITTAVGDVGAYVKNGINGFVVEDANAGIALANAANKTFEYTWTPSDIAASVSVDDWMRAAKRAVEYMQQDTPSQSEGTSA